LTGAGRPEGNEKRRREHLPAAPLLFLVGIIAQAKRVVKKNFSLDRQIDL